MVQYQNRRSSFRTKFFLFVSVVALSFFAAEVCFGFISNFGKAFFGPPDVELKDTYASIEGGVVFDHSSYDMLLSRFVDSDGFVDYEGMKTESATLGEYLETLKVAQLDKLDRDERLAFLLNAYNAFTIQLILEYYPVGSIKDIADSQRWDAVRWNIAGTEYSLSQIEHELIRPNFKEPRIHFALVCAAVGCPPLRNESYSGSSIESQLDQQAKFVHQHATWFDYNPSRKVLKLTKLYDWYGGDFEQVAGSARSFAAQYNTSLQSDLGRSAFPNIQWLDYDWGLNSQANRVTR